MSKISQSQPQKETTPKSFAEITPQQNQYGHDFTLQAIIEMTHKVGDLSAKVDRLITDVSGHGLKIDAVRQKLSWVAGGAAVVGFLVAVILAAFKLLPITISLQK